VQQTRLSRNRFRANEVRLWLSQIAYNLGELVATAGAAGADGAAMLAAMLGESIELNPLKGLIAERTGGNPFFIEEIVQSLFDEGALVRNGAVMMPCTGYRAMRMISTRSVTFRLFTRIERASKTASLGSKAVRRMLRIRNRVLAGSFPTLRSQMGKALK